MRDSTADVACQLTSSDRGRCTQTASGQVAISDLANFKQFVVPVTVTAGLEKLSTSKNAGMPRITQAPAVLCGVAAVVGCVMAL